MKTLRLLLASLLLCGTASAAVPASINNDDSCDVKVGPAATLLLPYFEVDVFGTSGQTTLFTIVNVTRYPQIAHVTLWTDRAYPVLTFNLFLTGYDVQAINLADVLVRGVIAPPSGTSQGTTPGPLSASGGNLRTPLDCANNPSLLPASLTEAINTLLTTGVFNTGGGITACSTAGGVHNNAIGYATIDVVANCTNLMPSDPAYFSSDLLFDNVLIGDYQQIGSHPAGTALSAFDAAGNPMVHIRAVPEGGGAGIASGVQTATNLPYTFYDRYTPATNRTIDRRQPLPSTFAARYIQGSPAGYSTNFSIWREGITGAGASCASYPDNGTLRIDEIIRFDEHENPFALGCSITVSPITCPDPRLPATSTTNTGGSLYPSLSGPDVGGWIYLNVNNGGARAYSITGHPSGTITGGPTATPFGTPRASQNWVTVTMFGNVGGSHMTAELDAPSLGNGCSPSAAPTFVVPIAPAGSVFVCPPGTTLTNGTTALCTGTNANPTP